MFRIHQSRKTTFTFYSTAKKFLKINWKIYSSSYKKKKLKGNSLKKISHHNGKVFLTDFLNYIKNPEPPK